MKKLRYIHVGAVILLIISSVLIYIFVYGNGCLGNTCSVYADSDEEEAEEGISQEEYFKNSAERYSDPEYIEALEIVQKEVQRRQSLERLDELEAEISRGRATQKALELREEIKSGE